MLALLVVSGTDSALAALVCSFDDIVNDQAKGQMCPMAVL